MTPTTSPLYFVHKCIELQMALAECHKIILSKRWHNSQRALLKGAIKLCKTNLPNQAIAALLCTSTRHVRRLKKQAITMQLMNAAPVLLPSVDAAKTTAAANDSCFVVANNSEARNV